MAINLITQPAATTPITNSDYTQQNLLINAALAQGDEVLTDWADTVSSPSIKQGVYFYHSGNSYQVQDSDSSISGTPVSGANYIGLAESGGVLTASYVTDISGYTWNPAYNGLYDGTTLIIRAMVIKDGTSNVRAVTMTETYGYFPIGFIYTQYPTKRTPLELGMPGLWADISSEFAGDFFRAAGGSASAFESGQQAFSTDLKTHTHGITDPGHTHSGSLDRVDLSGTGAIWGANNGASFISQPLNIGSSGTGITINSPSNTGDAETRPVNRTIILWERIS